MSDALPIVIVVLVIPGPFRKKTQLVAGMYLNRSLVVTGEVPALVSTRRFTSPAEWRGDVTNNFVEDTTWIEVPRALPKSTAATCVKRAPVTVTRVPPCVVPECGDIDQTAGSVDADALDRTPSTDHPNIASATTGTKRRSTEERLIKQPQCLAHEWSERFARCRYGAAAAFKA